MTDQILEFAQGRTVRALVLPYGEVGNGVHFSKGVVELPADPSSVKLRINHPAKGGPEPEVLGHGVSFEDTDKGIVGTFEIENNVYGDRLLSDHANGRKTSVSAEVANFAVEGARVVKATLQHVAAVVIGAFPSAAFFALDDVAAEAPTDEVPAEDAAEDLSSLSPEELQARIAEATDELAKRATEDPEESDSEDTADAPAPAFQLTESVTPAITVKEGTDMAEATVPNAASNGAPKELDANAVFELISGAKNGTDASAEFALADIKTSGTGALTVDGVLQPSWLGEVWAERSYTRKYQPLIKNGNITSMSEKGFVIEGGDDIVKPYSGNKADVGTGTATTRLVDSTFQRFAGAVDIAREFYDIPGNRDVIEAFIRRVVNGYAKATDLWTLQQLNATAGNLIVGTDVTLPTTAYSSQMAALIYAIDVVADADVDPTFAVVSPDVYSALRFTDKDKVPEFITFGAGRDGGSADGVTVVKDRTGTLADGSILVGAHDAAHVNELGGASPLVIDALDIARGGIDKAVHGYTQFLAEYPQGLIKLTEIGA